MGKLPYQWEWSNDDFKCYCDVENPACIRSQARGGGQRYVKLEVSNSVCGITTQHKLKLFNFEILSIWDYLYCEGRLTSHCPGRHLLNSTSNIDLPRSTIVSNWFTKTGWQIRPTTNCGVYMVSVPNLAIHWNWDSILPSFRRR